MKYLLQVHPLCHCRQTVYGIRYRAESLDDPIRCPDFQPEFMAAFSASLSLTTATGVRLTVSSAKSSQLVLKASAYSFTLTQSVKQADFSKVEAALALGWKLAFGGRFTFCMLFMGVCGGY